MRIGVTLEHREALLRNHFPVPEPIDVQAQLDTGAFITHVDANAINPLGIQSHGTTQFYTASTGRTPHEAKEFAVSITLLDGEKELRFWPSVRILETVFTPADTMRAIIGRDLLASCDFNYNGKAGVFTLTV